MTEHKAGMEITKIETKFFMPATEKSDQCKTIY